MRRYLWAAAIACPALWFVSFLFWAAGYGLFGVIPFALAAAIKLAFPFDLPGGFENQPQGDDFDSGPFRFVRRGAKLAILMWFFSLPEAQVLLDRIMDGRALWDWWLILPAGVWTLYACVSGLNKAAQVTDAGIYRYFSDENQAGDVLRDTVHAAQSSKPSLLPSIVFGVLLIGAGIVIGCFIHHGRAGAWYEVRDEKAYGSEDDPVVWRYVTDTVGVPFLDPGTTKLEYRGRLIYEARRGARESVPYASNVKVAGDQISWEDGELSFNLTVISTAGTVGNQAIDE